MVARCPFLGSAIQIPRLDNSSIRMNRCALPMHPRAIKLPAASRRYRNSLFVFVHFVVCFNENGWLEISALLFVVFGAVELV